MSARRLMRSSDRRGSDLKVVATLSLVYVVIALLFGCGSRAQDSSTDPPDSRGSTAKTIPERSPVSQDQAMEQIELSGTEATPINWRLPEVSGTPNAVLRVARYYIALDRQTLSTRDHGKLLGLYPALAMENELKLRKKSQWDQIKPEIGPLWYWIQKPQRDGEAYTVRACVDQAWNAPEDEQNKVPRPKPAARIETYSLKQDTDTADKSVWKVVKISTFGANHARDGFSEACANWAHHKPKMASPSARN